jgi:hypothetical protein
MRVLGIILGLAMLLGACGGGGSPYTPAVGHVREFLAAAASRDWAAAWTHLHRITQQDMFGGEPAALAAWCGGQSFGYPWGAATAIPDDPAFWRVEVALPAGPAGVPACLTAPLDGHTLAFAGLPGDPSDHLVWHVRLDSEGGSGIQASG